MKRSFALLLLLIAYQLQAQTTSVNVTFTHDGYNLNGRLQLPAAGKVGRAPVIIIAPGSGPNDRDATLAMNNTCLYPDLTGKTLKPYKGLSQALADSGYAVFTYDKLEYTYTNPGAITFHKLWLPVESAITYLKTRSDIDVNQIVLLGHSEGSSLIPYIARSRTDIKALISLAGPRRPLDTMLAYQTVYFTQLCGGDVNAANAQADAILQYFGDVRTGNYNSSTPAFAGASADVWADYCHVVDSVSINYNLAAKPTLFIGLGSDINVPIATELNRFKNEVANADFYSIPGLNHYLSTSNDPAVAEVVPDTIVYWLRRQSIASSVAILSKNDNSIALGVSGRKLYVTSQTDELSRINVYDVTGKIVLSETLEGNKATMELDECNQGMYIVEIKTVKAQKNFKVTLW